MVGLMSADVSPRTVRSTGESAGDHWWAWLLSLAAIFIPLVFLVAWYSIPNFALTGNRAIIAVRRGDLIVPVLILSLETIRRWGWVVKGGRAISIARAVGTTLCGLAAFLCLVAMNYATMDAGRLPTKVGDSVAWITVTTLVITCAFGTYAVAWSSREKRQ